MTNINQPTGNRTELPLIIIIVQFRQSADVSEHTEFRLYVLRFTTMVNNTALEALQSVQFIIAKFVDIFTWKVQWELSYKHTI